MQIVERRHVRAAYIFHKQILAVKQFYVSFDFALHKAEIIEERQIVPVFRGIAPHSEVIGYLSPILQLFEHYLVYRTVRVVYRVIVAETAGAYADSHFFVRAATFVD